MNSRYEKLKQVYQQNRQQWQQYEDECFAFANDFRKALAEYLGCDLDDVRLVRFSDDFRADNLFKFSLTRMMWLDNEAFWHFNVQTVIDRSPSQMVSLFGWSDDINKWVTVPFAVKKQDATFVVQVFGKGRTFSVQGGDFNELVRYTFEATAEWLEQEVNRFVHQEEDTLGFQITTGRR